MPVPILGGAALAGAGKLGLAAAGGAAVLYGIASWLGPFGPPIRLPSIPATSGADNLRINALRIGERGRRLFEAGKDIAKEVVRDLAKETLEKTVTTPFALITLTDAIGYWIASDLIIKSTYHSRLHVPTAETFSRAVDMITDTIGALLLVDVVSNRDVGSDLAESIVDSFNQSIVGDAIQSYIDTVAGVDPVDDDEVRDIVGEGAVESPEELAYLGARSGLDTFSAMAELYTGLLQGDNPYWSRIAREIDEILKRWERGLAADVYVLGTLIERIGEDLADAVYWYLSVFDYVENRIKSVIRDAVEMYAEWRSGGITAEDLDAVLSSAENELAAYMDVLHNLVDDSTALAYVDDIVTEYMSFRASAPYSALQRHVEAVLDDAGGRIAEYATKAREAYAKMREIRSVEVVAQ